MNGFFEHQYLAYKKNHIKNLLALAKADGHVHEKEVKTLIKIGKRYGLKERQVKELIDSKEKYEVNVPDNFNDKMDILFDLTLMVWADGVVEKKEIEFCEGLVKKFGLKKGVVHWLLDEVFAKGVMPPQEDWSDLKKEAKRMFVPEKK